MRLFAGLTEVVALCHRSNFVLRDLRPGNVIAEANRDLVAQLAGALPNAPASNVQARATAAMPPAFGNAAELAFNGLKMPETPQPNWLRPGKDGKCRNPVTGEVIHHMVIRGSCWDGAKRLPQTSCPDNSYDPPPEVMNDTDPKNTQLKEICFTPWTREGSSVAPNRQ